MFISSESGLNIPAEMIHYGVTRTAQVALARGPAETTAGMGQAEMRLVADLLVRTLKARDDEGEIAAVRAEVAALCARFPPYPDLVG